MKRLIFISLLIACCASPVLAYKTDTHELISSGAARLSGNYQKFISEFRINHDTANDLVLYGSVHEDDENFFLRRYQYHFYDPTNEKGLKGVLDPAPVWGYSYAFPFNEFSWVEARKALHNGFTGQTAEIRKQSYDKVFRSLGQIIHLIQDMAQPSHTRDDPHSSHYESTAGAFLLNPSHLEDWAQFHQEQISDFINSATSPRPVDSLEDAFETPALFSNQNFFSDDTIFKDYPLPSKEETNYTDAFIPLGISEVAQVVAEDGNAYNVPYIIKTSGVYSGYKLAQFGYFGPRVSQLVEVRELAFLIDDEVAKENAQLLIPQAVGYSAGLLDYFFRGRIDMVKDPNTTGQYLIQNKTAEPMSGTFNLYYDDTNNNRYLVTSWSNLSINPNGQSSSLTFKAPTSPQPKEKGKFILVFQGSLGSEDGAVIGAMTNLSSDPPLFVKFTLWDQPFTVPNRVVYWDIENDAEANLSDVEVVSSAKNIMDIKELTLRTSSYSFLPCGSGREGEVMWSGPNPGQIFLPGVSVAFGTLEVSLEMTCSATLNTTILKEIWSDRIFGYSFTRGNALAHLGLNIPLVNNYVERQELVGPWYAPYWKGTGTSTKRADYKFGIYLITGGVLKKRVDNEVISSYELMQEYLFGRVISTSFSGSSLSIIGGTVTTTTFHPTQNWAVTIYDKHDTTSPPETLRCGNLITGVPDSVHARLDIFDYDGTDLEPSGNKHLPGLGGFWVSNIYKCPSLDGLVTGTVVE